jgi:antitoxin component of MazEF toxin-antitoxin module
MASKTTTATKENLGRVGQGRQVVIPREIFDQLQMRQGDFVAISQKGNAVIVTPKRIVNADDTLTPEEAKLVRRGEAQLKRGQSKSWREVKDVLAR